VPFDLDTNASLRVKLVSVLKRAVGVVCICYEFDNRVEEIVAHGVLIREAPASITTTDFGLFKAHLLSSYLNAVSLTRFVCSDGG
jgi:hypothetical protein